MMVCCILILLIWGFIINDIDGFSFFSSNSADKYPVNTDKALEIRKECYRLLDEGRNLDLISYLEDLENKYGTLILDEEVPTLYNHLGVAYHNANDVAAAERSFAKGVME